MHQIYAWAAGRGMKPGDHHEPQPPEYPRHPYSVDRVARPLFFCRCISWHPLREHVDGVACRHEAVRHLVGKRLCTAHHRVEMIDDE